MARRENVSERRGRQKGRRFEVLENSDGAKYEIRYVSNDETFYAAPEKGLEFTSTDVVEVRKELKDYMRENASLEWESFIEVEYDSFMSGRTLGLEIARKFRAKKVDGSWVYRRFDVDHDLGIPDFEGADWADVLVGHPGGITCRDRSAKLILYKPERWAFLRRMLRTIKSVEKAIEQFVEQGEGSLIECLEGRKLFKPIASLLITSTKDVEEN